MELKLELKPNLILTDSTKERVLLRIENIEGFKCFYNLTKQNKKTKQVKNKETGKTTSTIIKKKKWVAYLYYIPSPMLEMTGSYSKLIQNTRNFTTTKR